jgi:hypothetical protein
MADAEFRTEVTQSLARAFAEGHSVDNAAVELKTLRMASNVPLARVKEAVVAAVVERIPLVEGDVAAQRREIGQVVGRWGDLINRIGGVDPVETVVMLQVRLVFSNYLFPPPLRVLHRTGASASLPCVIFCHMWRDLTHGSTTTSSLTRRIVP